MPKVCAGFRPVCLVGETITVEAATAVYLQLVGNPEIDASAFTFAEPSKLPTHDPMITSGNEMPALIEKGEG